jgi:SAM-dependent methyltransferase
MKGRASVQISAQSPDDIEADREANSFTTSQGRKIRYVSGYLPFVEKVVGLPDAVSQDYTLASANVAGGSHKIDFEKASVLAEKQSRFAIMGYASRLLPVYRMWRMLQTTDLRFPVGKLLDIGCGYGLQPRIMKAMGLVREAVGLDLYDRASAIDEPYLSKQHRMLRLFRFIDKWQAQIESKPASDWTDFERAFMLRFQGPRTLAKYRQGWVPGPDLYSMKFVGKPKLDRLIIADLFTLDERFDFITAFSSMEWFEAASAMKKISSLLNDGGIFYMYVANWWHSVTGGKVVGHFPFAPQRMKMEDYERYTREALPRNAEALRTAAAFYDPTHPTLRDYIRIGAENGLLALAFEQDVASAPFHHKYGISSRGWGELEPGLLNEALADIQVFRPDVSLSDLLATTTYIVFKKVNPDRCVSATDFATLAAANKDFVFRPTGAIGRSAKWFGKRIMRKR